jgi:hypothetical protein
MGWGLGGGVLARRAKAGPGGRGVENENDGPRRVPRAGQGAHQRQTQTGCDQGRQGVDGDGVQTDLANGFLDPQPRPRAGSPQAQAADRG